MMVKGQSLAEKAYSELEEKIVTLALKPGTIFSESELCESVEIGRTPLREALLKLANEKLVEMIPRRGVEVKEINISNHLALLDTRRVLDKLIACHACKRATEDQRIQLAQLAADIEKAAQNSETEAYMRLDKRFYEIISASARNPFATEASVPLHIHCRRFWYFYNDGKNLAEPAKLHADLMLAISSGEVELAEEASDRLLDYLVEFTRSVLEL